MLERGVEILARAARMAGDGGGDDGGGGGGDFDLARDRVGFQRQHAVRAEDFVFVDFAQSRGGG